MTQNEAILVCILPGLKDVQSGSSMERRPAINLTTNIVSF